MGSVAASSLGMDRTTLTANLKPLERRGLVRLRSILRTGGGGCSMLTPGGHSRLKAALPVWQRTHAESERLGRPTRKACAAGLRALS